MRFAIFLSTSTFFLLSVSALNAQNINVTAPLTSTSNSYYENIGVGFGFSIPGGRGPGSRIVGLSPNGRLTPNLNFGWGGGFGGGVQPGGGFLGFRQRGNNGGFGLGINFAKGSRRSIVSSAPSLTVQNGFGGSIFSGQTRPFVTGVVPIVGAGGVHAGWPTATGPVPLPIDNAVTRAINSGQLNAIVSSPPIRTDVLEPADYSEKNSSATYGDASVASIRAAKSKQRQRQHALIEEILKEAHELVDQGEFALARSSYRKALAIVEDKQTRQKIIQMIAETRNQ